MRTTIEQLKRQGWSIRQIARELGINRRTVAKYSRGISLPLTDSKCTTPPAGNWEVADSKCTTPPVEVPAGNLLVADSKCTTPPAGAPAGNRTVTDSKCTTPPAGVPTGTQHTASQSACVPYHRFIEKSLIEGLTAQRIYQDLRTEFGFGHSYDSVKRYVHKLKDTPELPFRRMETPPGEEVQIDYGTGYWLETEAGQRRKAHVLRVTLSASRKSYSEASLTQSTENFIRCIENAFRSFGGTTKIIVIDNLKAGVIKADLYDPDLNPKLKDFAAHYNCCILPSRARTPRHKGKVENGIKYIQNNALKGKRFKSLQALNEYLRYWEMNVADQRIHGTVRKQVRKMFEEEKPHLQPLPPMLFDVFEESKRKVHCDGHVEIQGSYYSVPPEYTRRDVWVRYTGRTVRIFDLHMRQIAVHMRVARGRFSTRQKDIPFEKISNPERGNEWLLRRIDRMGEEVSIWARAMLKHRGPAGTRVLNGLLQLSNKYTYAEMKRACKLAYEYGAFYLNSVRTHLGKHQRNTQQQFSFTKVHPLIRPVEQYEYITKSKEVFYAECDD